jgi:chromosome segregation ATPase
MQAFDVPEALQGNPLVQATMVKRLNVEVGELKRQLQLAELALAALRTELRAAKRLSAKRLARAQDAESEAAELKSAMRLLQPAVDELAELRPKYVNLLEHVSNRGAIIYDARDD